MASILVSATDAAEGFFNSLGIMTGSMAPVGRGAVGFGAVWLVEEAIKPAVMYRADGTKRPWSITATNDPDSTPLPWFMLPTVGAIVASVFI